MLEIGQPAPRIQMQAIETKRPVAVPHPQQTPMMLVFLGYQTATKLQETVMAVRRQYPDPAALLIANVVDLSSVPRLMRGAAESIMRNAYSQAAKSVPNGYDPVDQLILLPDWQGKVFKQYKVRNANQQLALVAVNGAGEIAGHYQGDNAVGAALDLALTLIEDDD